MLRDNSVFSRTINGVIERWTSKGTTPNNVDITYSPQENFTYSPTNVNTTTVTNNFYQQPNEASAEEVAEDDQKKQQETDLEM